MHPTKLQLPQEVTLMEVSPRDGLQNESVLLSTDAKLQLIDYALAAGCQRIEAVSFVHPKKVPQMADAEAVCAGLPQRGDVKYTGLILNERGYDRLLATERINEAGLVIAASDTFGLRNQGQDVEAALLMAQGVLARGRAARFEVQATIAVAFGCPFEGDVSPTRVVEMASALADAGATEIGPHRCSNCFRCCVNAWGPRCLCEVIFTIRAIPVSPMRLRRCRRVSRH